MTLYSYCLRYDDGAAPNPFWGICTLAICKPAIRRTAQIGDWIVGLGSTNSPIGNISTAVVYIMKVTKVLSMKEYDSFTREQLTEKIPDWQSRDYRKRVGDSIYAFDIEQDPRIRTGVHIETNRVTDLGGENVLLSDHFFYFGDKPIQLPIKLQAIVHRTQGHKSRANAEFEAPFVEWIEHSSYKPGSLLGQPQLRKEIEEMQPDECRSKCSKRDMENDQDDSIDE